LQIEINCVHLQMKTIKATNMKQLDKTNEIPSVKKLKTIIPNFMSGIRSIFTFGGDQSVYDELMNRTVEDGLRSDWYNIGQDIQRAMNKYKAEISWQKN